MGTGRVTVHRTEATANKRLFSDVALNQPFRVVGVTEHLSPCVYVRLGNNTLFSISPHGDLFLSAPYSLDAVVTLGDLNIEVRE